MITVAKPWIGTDLDGTLAVDVPGEPFDPKKIGAPILPHVARIKQHIADGIEVRIVTARYAEPDAHKRRAIVIAIQKWCLEHIGTMLKVTNQKDYGMMFLYDDRAVAMERNTGRIIGGDHPVIHEVTVEQAAGMLGMPQALVLTLIRAGHLRVRVDALGTYIKRADIEAIKP